MNMDERVYYWPQLDKYCYRSELEDYVAKYGHNYSAHDSGEFFSEIWVDKEED